MKIFIQMGYVSTREGARLHLDVGGTAHCHSGTGRIVGGGELTGGSATKVCRRCAKTLRTRLSWRDDDLRRLPGAPDVIAERAAIDALFRQLDDVDREDWTTTRERMVSGIRSNLERIVRRSSPSVSRHIITTDPEHDDQTSLF
jgi:hypothetical protein